MDDKKKIDIIPTKTELGSTAGVAAGMSGAYHVWVGFWTYIKKIDMMDGIGDVPGGWDATDTFLNTMFIFIATGGLVGLVHTIRRFTKGEAPE
jgi:hypothetical protein